MTADNWEPSPAIVDALVCAADSSKRGYDFYAALAKAVRPLIIAEAKPGIEAAALKAAARVAAECSVNLLNPQTPELGQAYADGVCDAAMSIERDILALKDSKP